jgi:thioredoxin
MKKKSIPLLLSALFLFLGMSIHAQTEKKPELLSKETFLQKVWNYVESPKECKYLGDKPCVIDFYADWCGPCRRIAPFMEELCKAYDGKIYVYKINTDQQRELATLFKAKSIPLVVFIPMTGKLSSLLGAHPKDSYEHYIKNFLLGEPGKQTKE